MYKLKHLHKVEVVSNDPSGCTFTLVMLLPCVYECKLMVVVAFSCKMEVSLELWKTRKQYRQWNSLLFYFLRHIFYLL